MATWTYADGEAKRKDFMVFWITDGSTTNITKDKLEIIGKGVEDMPISMNPETEESQDVLGNNNYDITGYAESMTVDPTNVSGDRYAHGRKGNSVRFEIEISLCKAIQNR